MKEYYRAYDKERDRTSFIYAESLDEAKKTYCRHFCVDPDTVEWSKP